MATTMLLDRTNWGLCLDAAGNWAMASEPYSQVQDVASAVRVFQGEAYYDTTLGIAYQTDIFGQDQPTPIMRAQAETQALLVPGVTQAKAFLDIGRDRTMTGQIQITTDAGVQTVTL